MISYHLRLCIFFLFLSSVCNLSATEVSFFTWGYESQWISKGKRAENRHQDWNLDLNYESSLLSNRMYLNRLSGLGFILGVQDQNQKENFHWNIDTNVISKQNSNQIIFGKNNYLLYDLFGFQIGVGRREHVYRNSPFPSSYDGTEGLFLEFSPILDLQVQIMVWDRYRGFPLKEKEIFTGIYQTENRRSNDSNFHHRRHGFGVIYGNFIQANFGIQFVELGTFGRHTRENERDVRERGGDGDSILNIEMGSSLDFEFLKIFLKGLATKGTDRTYSKESAVRGSIPIRGEALEFGIYFNYGNWKIKSLHFLPDSEERNVQNQTIRDGFISMGTHPGSTYFISQILQLFPSQILGGNGLEKEKSIYLGRFYSYFTELKISFLYKDFEFKLTGAYLVPYKTLGSSSGRIQFKSEFFEPFYLMEGNLELSLHGSQNYEIGVGVGQIYSNLKNSFEGNLGFFYAKVIL